MMATDMRAVNSVNELRFDDRVAVVTGRGRGIGRAHALLLASKGARVVVADHGTQIDGRDASSTPADGVVATIKGNGGDAVACFASVADEDGAALVVQTAIDHFGRLDIVVNNAGISDPAPFAELSTAPFRTMMDVHFFGTLNVIRAAWGRFERAGYGRVVKTVSEAILGGLPEQTSYAAAKRAVLGLSRNLATEGHALGTHVDALAPRAYTRMSAASSDAVADSLSMPREVMAEVNASMPPEPCAPACAFLAHETCPLNGEVLQIGMGGVARLAIVHTKGITRSPLTAEDIVMNLDSILDVTDAHVTTSDLLGG
jgi:NAD(P)-dependent dehydrogenase (short-subunit alcohol dehydrogenase family)